MPLLEIRNLLKNFGGLAAIHNVTFDVFDSEIVGLIGPNGAGKTTLFNVITGFYPPTSGSVIYKGEDITSLRAHEVAQSGIGRTFQASTLFMQSTVFDNVYYGFYKHHTQPAWKVFLHTRGVKREESVIKRRVMEVLEFMRLDTLKDELAANLPHGHQRTLGISIALATKPDVLLLDEPMTGMNATETLALVDLIRKMRDSGIAIVMVEHDMRAVMSLCDRIVVLSYGKKIAEGLPGEIRDNKEVIEAYLGKKGQVNVA